MALKLMRDNLKHLKWILWFVVLVFLLLVFVDWGSGRGRGGREGAAVRVGDTVFTEQQFLHELRSMENRMQSLYGKQWNQIRGTINVAEQTAQQLIQRQLLVDEARQAGLVVSDREVQDQILSYPAFRNEDGGFVGDAAYKRILRASQLTPAAFEEQIRDDLLIQKLQDVVRQGALISDDEVEREIRRQKESADFDVAVVGPQSFLGKVSAGDDEVEAYYAAHKDDLRQPEKRVIRYLVVETNTLRRLLPVDDTEIGEYYKDHLDEFREGEKAHAAHILIRIPGGDNAEAEAKAKLLAEQVAKMARSGADFATLAKKHSEDPGSKDKGGDLGWFERGRMVKEFEDAVFSHKPGEIVGPIKSQFGYHIIKVEGFKPARVRPLAEVKSQVKFRLLESRAAEEGERRATALARRIEREKPASNEAWDQLASGDEAVNSFVSPPFGEKDVIPGVGQNPDLGKAVFAAKVGETGGPVPVSRGWLIWQLKEIQPEGIPPLKEIKDKVAGLVVKEKALKLASEKATELAEAWKAGKDAEALAKKMGVAITPVRGHKRGQPIPGIGASRELDEAVFGASGGEIVGPVMVPDRGAAVSRIVAVTVVSPEELQAAMAPTRKNLEDQGVNNLVGSILEERRRNTVITVDQQLIERFAPKKQSG